MHKFIHIIPRCKPLESLKDVFFVDGKCESCTFPEEMPEHPPKVGIAGISEQQYRVCVYYDRNRVKIW